MPRTVIKCDQLPQLRNAYSYGVKAGGWVFTAGVLGLDGAGKVVGAVPGRPDVEAQTRQALRSMTIVLEVLGTSLDRVAKVKGYLTDLRHFDRYNSVYRECFRPPFPARATVGNGLVREDAVVEVEAIASVAGTPHEIRAPSLGATDSPLALGGTLAGDVLFVSGQLARDASGTGRNAHQIARPKLSPRSTDRSAHRRSRRGIRNRRCARNRTGPGRDDR